MTDDGRRFSEDEFAEILRRASELQARQSGPGREDQEGRSAAELTPPRGMSLADIESIAGEVGIDPALVRRAASSVGLEEVALAGGTDERFVLKRKVAGEMDRDSLVRVFQSIRDASGIHGETKATLAGVEWSGGGVVKTMITADTLDGRTELRVAVDATGAKTLSYFFPTLAGLMAGIIAGANLEPGLVGGIGVLGGGILSGVGLGRLIWRQALKRVRADATRLFRAGAAALPVDDGSSGDGSGS